MRYLVIASDGETIVKTVTVPNEETAFLQVGSGETLVAIDDATDSGAFINDATVKVDLTGSAPEFVNVSDGLAVSDTSLTALEVEEVSP
jgi:hypothetical protein